MREKLFELIAQVQDCGCDVTDVVEMNYVENDILVDYLIANGVTIQPLTDCKQQTNADRIRAMTDAELAEDYCEFLNATLKKVGHELDMEQAKSIMLKYLQKPAEGE